MNTTDLVPLQVQHAGYTLWHCRYLEGEALDQQLQYWKQKLQDIVPLRLPTDYPRPLIHNSGANSIHCNIDKKLSEQLQQLSQQQGVTLFMTLLAAFKILLYRYTGQQDICVGSAITGRRQQEMEGMIGLFGNTLILRSVIDGRASFKELLQQVRVTTLEAYEYGDTPFEKLVETIAGQRAPGANPLFQVGFALQSTPEQGNLDSQERTLANEFYANIASKFDVNYGLSQTDQGIQIHVRYYVDSFKQQTMERMVRHYESLLRAIVKDGQVAVDKLDILTQAEKQQLLYDFNDTTVNYPKDKSIIDLFEEQVSKTPTAIALIFEEGQLTYNELNERSNQLAHYLKSRGVKKETLVPICLERSPVMIIGILGILKAGGAYVPIDPDYPFERITFMLEDTGAYIVVSDKESRSKLPQSLRGLEILELDELWSAINGQPRDNLQTIPEPHHLAYVIYTSGSTGKPKGVMIEHKGVVNLSLSQLHALRLRPAMGTLQFSSFGFDSSCYEIFNTLLSGGYLVLSKKEDLLSAERFEELINKHKISLAVLPPSYLHFIKDALGTIETIVSAGEPLNETIGRYIQSKGIRLINGYGPTENTVSVSLSHDPIKDHMIVIGNPISNVRIYILDNADNLSPLGCIGEICVAGVQVARGYLNRPDLTAEKFVVNPFGEEPGARMYRTGDLGRWLPDGNIEYQGRKDDQVKIRGFRIELGEIESVMQRYESIAQAVVLLREDIEGNKRLTGYVVCPEVFDKEAIINYLRSKLPEHMVPGSLVKLEALPLTPSGKIDRKALPDPDASERSGSQFMRPRTVLEARLAEIWQQVLRIERVGVNDNFFELGGDSLLTIQMVTRVRHLGYSLHPKDLIINQNIGALSKVIMERSKAGILAEPTDLISLIATEKCLVPFQTEGTNTPFFVAGGFFLYQKLALYINRNQPFYCFEPSSYTKVEDIASQYIKEIKMIRPHGPYCLGGFCGAGQVALEMAHQLKASGEEISLLVFFEFYSDQAKLSKMSAQYFSKKVRYYQKETRSLSHKATLSYFTRELIRNSKGIFKRTFTNSEPVYIIKPYTGKVILFQATLSKDATNFDNSVSQMGWSKYINGEIEMFEIEGSHLDIFQEPGVIKLAEKLNNILA